MIKENICTYHNDIKMFATKIKKSTDLSEIYQYASEIIKIDKLAKTAGCHMENRLYQYRNAFEGLGYVRKKRKPYTQKLYNEKEIK